MKKGIFGILLVILGLASCYRGESFRWGILSTTTSTLTTQTTVTSTTNTTTTTETTTSTTVTSTTTSTLTSTTSTTETTTTLTTTTATTVTTTTVTTQTLTSTTTETTTTTLTTTSTTETSTTTLTTTTTMTSSTTRTTTTRTTTTVTSTTTTQTSVTYTTVTTRTSTTLTTTTRTSTTLTTTTRTTTTLTTTTVTTRTTTTRTTTTRTTTTRTTTTLTTTTRTTTTLTTTTRTTTTRTTTTRTTTTMTTTTLSTTTTLACPDNPAPGMVRIHLNLTGITGNGCNGPGNGYSEGNWPPTVNTGMGVFTLEKGPTCPWYVLDVAAGPSSPNLIVNDNSMSWNYYCNPNQGDNTIDLPASGHIYVRFDGDHTNGAWNAPGAQRYNISSSDPDACGLCPVTTTTTYCAAYTYVSWYEGGSNTENVAGVGPKGGSVDYWNDTNGCSAGGGDNKASFGAGTGPFGTGWRMNLNSGYQCYGQTEFYARTDETKVDMSGFVGGFVEVKLRLLDAAKINANYKGFQLILGANAAGDTSFPGYNNADARFMAWMKPTDTNWHIYQIPLVSVGTATYPGAQCFENTGDGKGFAITQAWGNNSGTTMAGVLARLNHLLFWTQGSPQVPDPVESCATVFNQDNNTFDFELDYIRFAYPGCAVLTTQTTVPGTTTTTLGCNDVRWMYNDVYAPDGWEQSYGSGSLYLLPPLNRLPQEIGPSANVYSGSSSAYFSVGYNSATSPYTFVNIPTRTPVAGKWSGLPPISYFDETTDKDLSGQSFMCFKIKGNAATVFNVRLEAYDTGNATEDLSTAVTLGGGLGGLTVSGAWQNYCLATSSFGTVWSSSGTNAINKVRYVRIEWDGGANNFSGDFWIDNLRFDTTNSVCD